MLLAGAGDTGDEALGLQDRGACGGSPRGEVPTCPRVLPPRGDGVEGRRGKETRRGSVRAWPRIASSGVASRGWAPGRRASAQGGWSSGFGEASPEGRGRV